MNRMAQHLAKRCSALTGALALCGCTTVNVTEAALLHPTRAAAISAGAAIEAAPGYAREDHQITTPDGVKLAAVLFRKPGSRFTVLYFGGNMYRSGVHGPATLRMLTSLGVDVMLVDHRGYGLSEGRPSAETMESDGLAAFDFLAGPAGRDSRRIIVHGQSLGSLSAGYVAERRETGGVVLESSITTTEAWAAARVPVLARPFVRLRLAESLQNRGNLARMSQLEEPVLVLAGEDDSTTWPRFSQALYDASPLPPQRKTLFIAPRAGHNDVLSNPEALAVYREFLERAG